MNALHSFACRASDIAQVVQERGLQGTAGISNFIMHEPGRWRLIEYSPGSKNRFEQVRTSWKRKTWEHRFAFALDALPYGFSLICDLVMAHYIDGLGAYLIQGIEIEPTEPSNFVTAKVKQMRVKIEKPEGFELWHGYAESANTECAPICFLSEKEFEAL